MSESRSPSFFCKKSVRVFQEHSITSNRQYASSWRMKCIISARTSRILCHSWFNSVRVVRWEAVKQRCYKPGNRRNDLAPPVTFIQHLSRIFSTRFICQRCLNNLRYLSVASWSSTVSIGGSTLYSKVKTSQPISPWEYSSIRASKRRKTSVGSCCTLEERMAVSKLAVKLCR